MTHKEPWLAHSCTRCVHYTYHVRDASFLCCNPHRTYLYDEKTRRGALPNSYVWGPDVENTCKGFMQRPDEGRRGEKSSSVS